MFQNTFFDVRSDMQPAGVQAPLDEIILDDFKQDNGWLISGGTMNYDTLGGTLTLSGTSVTLSKKFTYATWKYSDLNIKIAQITAELSWELLVQGEAENAQLITIQPESQAQNSSFGEAFSYSLKGIAGTEPLSDWNDSTLESKTFTLTMNFKGDVGQFITLGVLTCSEPNYEIPQALPSSVQGNIGGINFDGDPTVDVDTLKNDDPTNISNLKEYRNLSLPFSRLVTNPEYNFDNQEITPVEPSMDLRFGAYYGIKGNANRTSDNGVNLREKKSGFQDSSFNAIMKIDDVQASGSTITSAWFPHKVELSGSVEGLGKIATTDFFVDESTLGRLISLSEATGSYLEIELRDSTTSSTDYNTNNLKCYWDDVNEVVLKTDTQHSDWNQNLFITAIKVVALTEDGSIDTEATAQIIPPTFVSGIGKYRIPTSISSIGLAVGYANREEGEEQAIIRALNGVGLGEASTTITAHYNSRKTYWDNLLSKVPVSSEWGLESSFVYHSEVVTPEKHRILYYAAWTHLICNILAPTTETGYAFTQQALGKPSRQCAGAAMTPPNNSWEGLLQIQDLMYINPSIAWSGMEGFMSMVDANGFLSGEVLPVRMGQTLWMIHNISPDLSRLGALYPALKRHLEWKFEHPRWIYESTDVENEVDSEFMISVMNDTQYMIKICELLGNEYATEISYWQELYAFNLKNYADWMFCDPLSHEALYSYPQNSTNQEINRKVLRNGANLPDNNYQRGIWQYIFLGCVDVDPNNNDIDKYIHARNSHLSEPPVPRSTTDLPNMLSSGLILPDLPTEQAQQLEQFTLDIINPALSLCGYPVLKWAPNSLMTHGLINRGFYDEAKILLESYIVRGTEIWQFCENYFWNTTGPRGTYPTSFGASQIIDSTMMRGGFIYNEDGPHEIPNWSQGMNKPITPPIDILTDVTIDLSNPEETLGLIGMPVELRQSYQRTDNSSNSYELGKIVAVTWKSETLSSMPLPNQYTVDGETEMKQIVSATITSGS